MEPPSKCDEQVERLSGSGQKPSAPAAGSSDAANRSVLQRFLASTVMDFDMWHDGTGYDLTLLDRMSQDERAQAEEALIRHSPRDWRDIEALARIDSSSARREIEAALTSTDNHVRQEAIRHAGEKARPADREQLLVRSLDNDLIYGGLTQAIEEVATFHPPAVVDALFRGALNRDGEIAVHFAALLMFIHGKAAEPLDWDYRPFFLRFHTTGRAEREIVFRELCQSVGVDPAKYLR
jgi:hypothetical protein